jgi:hypothetical protein
MARTQQEPLYLCIKTINNTHSIFYFQIIRVFRKNLNAEVNLSFVVVTRRVELGRRSKERQLSRGGTWEYGRTERSGTYVTKER